MSAPPSTPEAPPHRQAPRLAPRGGFLAGALVLTVLFVALVAPVYGFYTDYLVLAHDQRVSHLPLVHSIMKTFPRADIRHTTSATAPGLHYLLAAVGRYVWDHDAFLRGINALFGLGIVLLVYGYAARLTNPAAGFVLALPVLCNKYVLESSIWLYTDNAALFFVLLVLVGVLRHDGQVARVLGWGLCATAAVLVRQNQIWLLAVLAGVALEASRWRTGVPARFGLAGAGPARGTARATLFAMALPVAALAALVMHWGGLVPPGSAPAHRPPSFAAPAMLLALLAALGCFYLPVWRRELRRWDWALVLTAAAGAGVAVLSPTHYDVAAERYGGPLWEVIRRTPVVAQRSVLVTILAAAGAGVALLAWRSARRSQPRAAGYLLLATVAWGLVQAANPRVFERYYQPFLLIVLSWWAAQRMSAQKTNAWWWLGPVLLAAGSLAYTWLTLYQQVYCQPAYRPAP